MTSDTVFDLIPFRYDNLQAFLALCGLMRILSESKPEWKPVCRWEKTDDTRGFRLEIKLSGEVSQNDFVNVVYGEVKKYFEEKKEFWVSKPEEIKQKEVDVKIPLTCGYTKEDKSPYWMSDVNPQQTAKKLSDNLTDTHIRDSLFNEWDYGERSAENTRRDKTKYILTGNFCWDPINSSRTQSNLGYQPNTESPPVEAGAHALAGCGWEVFPCVPQAKWIGAPCYFKENPVDTIRYPLWNVWLGFEEIKSLLWSNWIKTHHWEQMGIIAVVSVGIKIEKKRGKRALPGQIIQAF